jgi:hypothetical protein
MVLTDEPTASHFNAPRRNIVPAKHTGPSTTTTGRIEGSRAHVVNQDSHSRSADSSRLTSAQAKTIPPGSHRSGSRIVDYPISAQHQAAKSIVDMPALSVSESHAVRPAPSTTAWNQGSKNLVSITAGKSRAGTSKAIRPIPVSRSSAHAGDNHPASTATEPTRTAARRIELPARANGIVSTQTKAPLSARATLSTSSCARPAASTAKSITHTTDKPTTKTRAPITRPSKQPTHHRSECPKPLPAVKNSTHAVTTLHPSSDSSDTGLQNRERTASSRGSNLTRPTASQLAKAQASVANKAQAPVTKPPVPRTTKSIEPPPVKKGAQMRAQPAQGFKPHKSELKLTANECCNDADGLTIPEMVPLPPSPGRGISPTSVELPPSPELAKSRETTLLLRKTLAKPLEPRFPVNETAGENDQISPTTAPEVIVGLSEITPSAASEELTPTQQVAWTDTATFRTPISSLFAQIQQGFMFTPASPLSPPHPVHTNAFGSWDAPACLPGTAPAQETQSQTEPSMLHLNLEPTMQGSAPEEFICNDHSMDQLHRELLGDLDTNRIETA